MEQDVFPLSFAQERFWFLYLLAPERAAYNITLALDLAGALDVEVFRRSLEEIVRRHEVLRTRFPLEAVQVPVPPGPFPLSLIDASAGGFAEARRVAEEEAGRPFDLRSGPPFRALLVRVREDRWLAVLALHHIVGDGRSLEILLGELSAIYGAFLAGRPSPLPVLPLQYADFAAWQRERLQRDGLVEFWREALEGAPAAIELPADRPRPAIQGFRGARVTAPIPAAPLLALSRARGVTPFMVLLAGFQAFLYRVTGQDDLPVGSPVADRGRTEIEDLIGLFVNTLVLRGRIDPEEPFGELLERTKGATVAALAHQDLPFEKLVEALGVEHRLDRNPLFQVSLAFQGEALRPPELPGVAARVVEDLELDAVPFDLGLAVQRTGDDFELALEHSTDRFDPATARRLLGQLRRLLAGAAADPGLPVLDLPLLSEAEHHQVAVEWNDTRSAYPREATLHELFAARAAAHPETVALVQGEETLSYGELAARAGRIAEELRKLGVGPDVPVAVALPRSFDLIAALLGILAAGGAYVPIDLSYPEERRSFLLRDSGAAALVGSEGIAPLGPVLDRWGEPTADSLAYVMYTSGSTGTPKGVAVTHRNVARLVLGADYARFGPEEVFLQLAPVSFDASTLEIWGPLLHGGRLVLAPPGRISLASLSTLLWKHGVTTLWLTAGLFHQMVDEEIGGLAGLRQLLAGGDALSPVHVRRILEGLPGVDLINGYGPTEGTTFSACRRLTSADLAGTSVPIGRPIANAAARVLDASLRPVPPGTPGDLYLGGDGLARGYLGRPDLIAERFVPDPFADGGRLYRTGDRARLLADGRLEFLGRSDLQVKIAGWRIEPGEVEAALAGHPQVRAAAVAPFDDGGPAGKRLAAWVAAGPPAPSPAALRAWLRERLPEPMVPSLWTVLDALPLTPNGKVDRRALPAPRPGRGDSRPASETEARLAEIWTALLGVPLGLEDDAFLHGGNSLLALQAVSRIREAFGVEIPVEDLFAAPTPAALARRLEEGTATEPLPPVLPVDRQPGMPLSPAQERLWFLERLRPGSAYNVPLALRLRGPLDVRAWTAALDEVRRRHEALRTTFHEGPEQRIVPWAPLGLPVVEVPEEEAERTAADLAARPFDLARELPFRAALLRLGAEDHLFVAVFHHVVSDAWSLRVFLNEMRELYGGGTALPEPPVQPADYAVWERRRLARPEMAERIAGWRERLAGLPPLELPVDRPGRSFHGRTLPVAPSAALLSRGDGTPFMVALAAFAALLHRVTGGTDLAIGTPVAHRDRPELEGLIGFLVNTLVIRLDLAGDPPFSELLRRVRGAALAAYARREVPFDRLVEELRPERRADENPLFQVAFSLDRPEVPDFPGLAASPVRLHPGRAKFDLWLGLEEGPEGIGGAWDCDAGLFDPATLARLAGHWENLTADLAAHPERRIGDLALLSPAERHQVAVEWPDSIGARVLDAGGRPAPIGALQTGERARWRPDGRIEILAALPVSRETEAAVNLPATPAEELLAGIWAELLGVERVGTRDDFFELGGHSLLATRLIARVHALFGVDLPLRDLFEAPTVAGLAGRIAEAAAGGPPPPIEPLPPGGIWPASLAQRRLWFLDRLAPGNFFLNVPHGLRLRGVLSIPALRRALTEIVERHEPLRTTFETRDGQPVQRIAPAGPVALPGIDLSALPPALREAEAQRRAREQAEQPFDLSRGPLFRAVLVRLGPEDHLLVFTPHHLVFDGWSMGVLFRELAALYAGSPLPPLPVRFVEFAEQQRRALSGRRLESQLAGWRRRLAGLPTLELPTDHPRPRAPRFGGSWRTEELPGLNARIEALARRHGATPYLVLLAAFSVLLSRLSGQEDLAVGSPVANRSRPEVEGLIGFFVNTLVMRADLAGNPRFSELLSRVRENALGAWAHQDLPFEVLVEELAPERHLSLNPLFQVLFSLQELPPGFDLPGLEARLFEFEADVAHFDLSLIASRAGDGLSLTFSYKRDLFDPPTVLRWLDHLRRLLEEAVADPGTPVRDLPLWSEGAWHQATREWSGAGWRDAEGRTVDRLVEEQARRTPDALAVGSLTYAGLDAQANRLARRLRHLGVGRGDVVALTLEPSPELVLAALAVWKAGAAYLPLDPANPAERLGEIVEDARASRVLTLERWAGRFPGRAVALDRDPWRNESDLDLGRETGPEDAAYVIYTSGSTGRPKGVVVPHAGLLGLIAWHQAAYRVTPADRAGLVGSPAFDVSVLEIWPLLAAGASLHAPPREIAASPAALLDWLAAEGITFAFLVTPLAEGVLARERPAGLALRALLTGGDRLRRAPASDPGFRLFNNYGPAESSVVATLGAVQPGDPRPPDIGRAVEGIEVLLLDPGLRPVPQGALGEICLAGRGLATGYLHHPDRTAERFVPHPLSPRPGARLYRTGDLGRARPDGRIEFAGRTDHQVKIRGFRIEPGEVEARLATHPAVREAVVMPVDSPAGPRLAAWYVPRPGQTPTEAELRDHLRARLPEPMVPSAWMALSALPLTSRGKVDREALPPPPPPDTGPREAPRGALEETVERLWREVLGIPAAGRDDNFFDLGGHSLALAAVHERLQAELALRIPLVDLFENPTVRTLAARLEGQAAPQPGVSAEVLERAGRQRSAGAWKDRMKQARGIRTTS